MDNQSDSENPNDFQSLDPLGRFSTRAALYNNRARYPAGLREYLRSVCGVQPGFEAADVGAGTGFLSAVLLELGCRVFAIEPNAEMRMVAEETFARNERFISLEGRAECLPLPDISVDAVMVGQALHWFNIEEARPEFLRVLKPGGLVVIVDNRTRDEASPFMQACRTFQKAHFADVGTAAEPPLRVVKLFEGCKYILHKIPFTFSCSRRVFQDGFLSSSLAPQVGSAEYASCADGLSKIFDQYQADDKVELHFETVVYWGRFD